MSRPLINIRSLSNLIPRKLNLPLSPLRPAVSTRLIIRFHFHLRCHKYSTMAPIPSTMKAVTMAKTGGLEVLEHGDRPVPTLGEGQVLVRNEYGGVNYIDTYFRTGLYPIGPTDFPYILGREGSGTVVSSDASVTNFPPGTRVVYMGAAAYSEYTAIEANKLVQIPEGVTTAQACAVWTQGLTAWTFIKEAVDVKPGQWVLVHAAAGGVGLLMLQMLRTVGAKVIGTASSEEKLALARENGAEWTINSADNLVAKVKEITGGHGVDVIFDGVGKATFEADLEMIAMKGHLVSFGNASGAVDPFSILKLGPKNVKLMRPVVYGYVAERADLERYSSELFDMISSGKVNIRIHEVYPLADAKRAHADIESRKTTGKLLLKCD